MYVSTQRKLRLLISTAALIMASLIGSRLLLAQTPVPKQLQSSHAAAKLVLPPGVEKLCSIEFDADARHPARVEDAAATCLNEIVSILKSHADKKVVLVGVSDPVKDHENKRSGAERMVEDKTGEDIRYEDIAAYRALNTKDYLVHVDGIDPARVIPTTNEFRHGQEVSFYLVPGDADFLHNYLNTTRSNENPCTVTPCYDSREESLTAQPRNRIAGDSSDTAHR